MHRRLLAYSAFASASSGALASSESGGGGMSLINPTFGLSFWTFLTFILLLLMLRRFAWKPLLGALDERQRSIEGSLAEAEKARVEAAKLLDEHRDLVAQAHRERAQAVATGQQEAERLKSEILDQARAQREQLLKQTDEQIKAGIQEAQESVRRATADLAVQVAEKLLARTLDDPSHRRLVEDYLADLEKPPAG